MNRRFFARKATGVLAAIGVMVGVKVRADTIEIEEKPKADAEEPYISIRILGFNRGKCDYLDEAPHLESWRCEYQVHRVDGTNVIRESSSVTVFKNSPVPPMKHYYFDLS